MGIGAALIGGAVLSAGAGIYGANKAASAQTKAANSANQLQMDMFNKTQENLSPFIGFGQNAGNRLNGMMDEFLKPFNPTMEDLEKTPGYQFTLDQGEKATQNANSAKGWGLSGAGQKGLIDYASGLASNTYQQQFNNFWTNKLNAFNMLQGQEQLGANAAASQGGISAQVGANIGNNIVGAGNAQAGAAIGTANAIGSIPNMLLQYQMLNKMFPSGGAASGGSPSGNW